VIRQHQGREIGRRVREVGPGGEHLAIAAGRLLALSGRGERVGEIESGLVTLRLKRERAPMAGDGFIQPAEAAQQVAEIHLQHGVAGHAAERVAIGRFGGVELPQVAQRIAEIEMGRPHIRLQRECAAIALGRGRRVALRRVRVAEVEPQLGDARMLRQGPPVAGDCVRRAPELAQRAGESDQRFEIVRIGDKPRLPFCDRALDSSLRKRHATESSGADNNVSECRSSGRSAAARKICDQGAIGLSRRCESRIDGRGIK
jgi:hypothetical protein